MIDDYVKIANRFTEALKTRRGARLHAVVLYGSVARGTAHSESDIDLLVITGDPDDRTFKITEDIAYQLDAASGFTAFVAPVEFSPQQAAVYLQRGDPFLERVLREGRVLYDDGTFQRLRRQIVAARA
ncbi:MAG: nucleotidyltransferase domain-containing protein [Acidobacteriota bacterium]